MLSALLAGLGTLGLNTGSSLLTFGFDKYLQDDAQKHQIKMMQNAHQWQVKDLRKAGLNPILSAGGSPGNYSASANSVGSVDLGRGLNESIATAQDLTNEIKKKEAQLLDEQINSAKAQADVNLALAEKYSSEAFNTDLNSAFEYSRDVLNLKKREMYNRGTPDLNRFFGLFKDEVDKFNGYSPWHSYDKGNNVWDLSNSPRRQHKLNFSFKK